MALIVVVGGADTGRAPMGAVLLRRLLLETHPTWQIESAGVLGHDGDTWQPEARMALEHLNATPPAHTARSLSPALAMQADLLLAVDRGVGRALELQYPDGRWQALPDLAESAREVLDPFRMTLDAWLIYGRELEHQLKVSLSKIIAYCQGETLAPSNAPVSVEAVTQPIASPVELGSEVHPAYRRLHILAFGIAGIPEVVDWAKARNSLREAMQSFANHLAASAGPSDLRPAALAMLGGVLGAGSDPLSSNQLVILREIVGRVAQTLDPQDLAGLAGAIGRWQS
ncbi:low molecular weight phosphatase family protein [Herpetosiphon giganteus]|uniref:arsenate-mycothiol transferase ArsC n=1 Tax=Herpetosiphon giganteus TaxID=2029754 RepID=UPI00195C9CE8|nr:hypothetical protein [Herpetosiphon giganteus]MBM7843261.1 protein-tyrosine-phosphatase [Herpetosiphon giganteus]